MIHLRGNRIRGAIIFIVIFLVFLGTTLSNSDLPTGKMIYGDLGMLVTAYHILGIQVTTLVIAVLNGVIYGLVAYVISIIADKAGPNLELFNMYQIL